MSSCIYSGSTPTLAESSPLNPKSQPFREQRISAQPQKIQIFYSCWAVTPMSSSWLTDWLTVGYVFTVQTTKNTWRYHREIWSWKLEIPSDLCQDRPLYPMPTCTHKDRTPFFKGGLSEGQICPWVLANLSTWRWTIPPVFQETEHKGCICATRSTGLRAECKAVATAHGNLDLQAAKRSNMLCQR